MIKDKRTPAQLKACIAAMQKQIRKTEYLISLRTKAEALEQRLDDLRKQL